MTADRRLWLFKPLLRMVLTVPALLFIGSAHGQTHLTLESGLFWQHQNDIQIPRNDGTPFTFNELVDGGSSTFVRFTLNTNLYKRHDLRVVYAPLRLQLLGEIDRPLQFADDAVKPGVILGTWRFKSNRVTWRYRAINKSRWLLKTGLTLLIRDRVLTLEQNTRRVSYTETRRLPLIHFSGQYLIYKRWQLGFDLDGMASSQNRFFDFGIRLEYGNNRRKAYSLGYRLLDFSVNNSNEHSATRMHYFTAGVRYRF